MTTTTLEQRISEANDRVQQSAGIGECKRVLQSLPLPILCGVADLNYVDTDTSAARIRADLLLCVFPSGEPRAHVDYPHGPGALYDCPACEDGVCVCDVDGPGCVAYVCPFN